MILVILKILTFPKFSCRNDNNNVKGRSVAVPSPLASDKTEGTVALVKSGVEKVKTTPAGEYLTSALNDFDPEQYDSLAAISDGANKLLMLVRYKSFCHDCCLKWTMELEDLLHSR